jgi:hypothetical protein
VGEQSTNFAIKHTDQLCPLRHRDLEQLFACQAEGVLLVHRRYVIEAIEIADRLQVGLMLDQLFGTAVQKTDVGVNTGDDLTVELEHETQHAMGGRMLWTEIDVELTDIGLGHCYCFAFSSPGSTYSVPSHGLMKSKERNSCGSRTGS